MIFQVELWVIESLFKTNCSADATPCGGPIPVCCPSG